MEEKNKLFGENNNLKKILIVDDITYVVKTIHRILQDEGYFVLTAKNGMEALNKFRDYKPDLVTVDGKLPDMNGEKLIDLLRKEEYGKDVKIIFISANYDKDFIKSILLLGVNDYLIKPFIKSKLIESVKKVFSNDINNKDEV